MIADITGQSGSGMVHMQLSAPAPITDAEALAVLPSGSSIHPANHSSWCTVVLNVPYRVARSFNDYTAPWFIPGWDRYPTFTLRRENLGAFVRQWQAFA